MIREYSYFCEKCNFEFTEWYNWNTVAQQKPDCKMCKSNKQVYRNFGADKVIIDDGVPKTLGVLADRNSKNKGIK
jgi:hypothetical protein